MTKSFTVIVEGKSADPNKVAPSRIEQEVKWAGDTPPDVLLMPTGEVLHKIGRYLEKGDRYRYAISTVAEVNAEGTAVAWEDDEAA